MRSVFFVLTRFFRVDLFGRNKLVDVALPGGTAVRWACRPLRQRGAPRVLHAHLRRSCGSPHELRRADQAAGPSWILQTL